MKACYLLPIVLIAAILFAGCTSTAPAQPGTAPGSGVATPSTVRVDAFLPLTGAWSQNGESAQAALLTASDDINQYYTGLGVPTRVNLTIYDTATDPATARRLLEQVRANGTTIVLGPMTSAQLLAMKDYADTNGMILISSGSSAPSLAIPNDSIYRVVSDDTAQGKIMSSYLARQKIHTVVPVWRGDIWGDELKNATKSGFEAKQGTMLSGVRYPTDTKDFNATVNSLDIQVGNAIAQYGAGNVGVYAVTFNEIGDIMTLAGTTQNLSLVRWFGSDGNTRDPELAGSSPAARFAAQTNMTGAVWGTYLYGSSPARSPVNGKIQARLGREPEPPSVALYDTLWVIVRSQEDTKNSGDRSSITKALTRQMETYSGSTGSMLMNRAGDRILASYDLVQIRPGINGSQWKAFEQIHLWPDNSEEIVQLA